MIKQDKKTVMVKLAVMVLIAMAATPLFGTEKPTHSLSQGTMNDGYEVVYQTYFTKVKQFDRIRVYHYPLGQISMTIDTEYLEKKAHETLTALFPNLPIGKGKQSLKPEEIGQISISVFTKPYLSKINIFYIVEVGNKVAFHEDVYEEMDMFSLKRKHLTFELGLVVEHSIKTFGKRFYLARKDTIGDYYSPIIPSVQ